MSRTRRIVSALLGALLLAAGAMAASPASAAEPAVESRIFADYALDRAIDGPWEIDDLNRALTAARGQGAGFREFQRAVERVLDARLLGVADRRGAAATGDGPSGLGVLPRPTLPGDREHPPWVLMALAGLAGGLMLAGAGSTLYRRLAR